MFDFETKEVVACPLCGKMPTDERHDQCIANLPGVVHACCGHGIREAYVVFDNGMVLRGEFDHVQKAVKGVKRMERAVRKSLAKAS